MRFTMTQMAEEHERFSSTAFDSQIGKVVAINLKATNDGPVLSELGQVRLVSAEVVDGGRAVHLEYETVDSDKWFTDTTVDDLVGRTGSAEPVMSFSTKASSLAGMTDVQLVKEAYRQAGVELSKDRVIPEILTSADLAEVVERMTSQEKHTL